MQGADYNKLEKNEAKRIGAKTAQKQRVSLCVIIEI